MKKFEQKVAIIATIFWLVLGVSCILMLTSCGTSEQGGVGQQSPSASKPVYDVNILLYTQPVEATGWKPDTRQSVNSEGASLNIVVFMQRGDVDGWLNCWAPDSRPHVDDAGRQKLLEEWAPLKGGRVFVLGHVVAGVDLIEQIEVQETSGKTESLQLPIGQQDERWWLKKMDANTDYMHWKTAAHKKVDHLNPEPLRHYVQDTKPQAN
jgi:hypothetical protein